MSFVSYSQNMEDVLLWRALKEVEAGFYIDVGAADPEEYSVTRAFYDRGWSGINIEPLGDYFQRLTEQRTRDQNIRAVLGAKSGIARLNAIPGTGLSTLDDGVAEKHKAAGWEISTEFVPRLTLTSLMEERGDAPIHFLKIDVEGAERSVLEGADLGRFRPWVIVVEATAPLSPEDTRREWEDLLVSQRYSLAIFDGLNCFYVAEEHPELIEKFSVPANVFDDFVRIAEQHSAGALAQAQAEAAQQREQAALAQVELAEGMAHLQAARDRLELELRTQREAFEARLEALNRELDTAGEKQRLGHEAEIQCLRLEADATLASERSQHITKIEALLREQNEADYLRTRLADSERRAEASDNDRRTLRTTLIESQRVQGELCERYLDLVEAATRLDYRLKATLASHSWRMTGIIRSASRIVRSRPPEDAELEAADRAVSAILALPKPAPPATDDADTAGSHPELSRGAMLILRRLQVRGAARARS